ncbi:MAG: alpha/beta fold hydrolase [Bacteroidales bacterium]
MKLFYRKFGSGKPMIILHGLYGSSDNWVSIARELASDFEVFLVDLRNHGKSPHDDRHNYELIRDDLLLFMNETGIGKAMFTGHSMGGKAAMCFVQHHPDRVEKLIVVDIAPKSYKELYRKEPLNHFDILTAMRDVDLSSVSSRRDIDRMLAGRINNERIRSFLMKNISRDKDDRYYWTLNLDVLIRELDNIMDGVNEHCFDPAFPVTGIPVLFIRGGKSPYITDADIDFIEQIFPSAKLHTIPGTGHWLHAENPGAFTDAVRNFAI